MCWVFLDAMIFCNNFMLPKRRFWKADPTFPGAFSKHFSTVCSPNRVLTPLRRCFENAFGKVRPIFQNLRLGGVNFARWLQKIVATCDAMSFCNNFARWLQKIVATCDVMCWVFWDAMIFCNNFARWLQKIVATCDVMCWFSEMLRSFVTTLQEDYKR